MTDPDAITQDVALRKVADALGLFCGFGKRFSTAALAAATGIPERTIKAYKAGEVAPGFAHLIRLMAALPPEFADMLLGLAGLGGCRPVEAAEPDGFLAMERISRRLSMLALALRDRRLDHQEKRELAPEIAALSAELAAFADGLKL